MLAIWSLVPLPFLTPAWISESSQFTYCWSLTWRILNITLLSSAAAIAKSLQLCPTLCNTIDGSPPGSPVPGILQARLQQYVNRVLPDVQAGFRKGRGTRDQIANWIIENQESSRKTSISALLTMPKPLTVQITINCGKFWKRWEYQTSWLASWETYMQVRKQQFELDMEQQTGSK